MLDNTKTKKTRIYKFASEYNLATEAIMEFLQQKGHEVKSHMTLLTEEMIADISGHFKKDIEKAEMHYRKISEFQKKRSDKAEADAPKEPEVAEVEVLETPAVEEKQKEDIVPEIIDDEIKSESDAESATETPEMGTPEIEKQQVEEEPVPEIVMDSSSSETDIEEEPAEEVLDEELDDTTTIYKTKAELEFEGKKKGLTVVGKIDLSKPKKDAKGKDKRKDKSRGKEEISGSAPTTQETGKSAAKPEIKPVSEDAEKKLKKKRLKAKTKKKGDLPAEEQVKSKKLKKIKKLEVDKREVEAAIKRTMIAMDETNLGDRAASRKKKKKEKHELEEQKMIQQQLDKTKIKVTEYIAVSEIANLMNVPVAEVIQKCIGLGLMVSINQRLDVETITLVADEFGFDVEFEEEFTSEVLEDVGDEEEELQSRPPVVTIMGHVDHGKTSLLDYIRKANVVAGESGGITQHIGAYQVEVETGKHITFLDTPGHEAFTAMRARGAKVTDIVILIVAADDAVMPQTIEAINHAQAASVPIIVAINKIDKPGSNIEKIKQQLAERNILVEDWGGRYQCVEVSAKAGTNIDLLMEKILLEAELLDLKANPDRLARGAVIETKLELGRGVTATILVEKGTLKVGDSFVAGNHHGRVRAMFDERNKKVKQASPASPVVVVGFEGSPQAGDTFIVVDSEREAREIAIKRQQLKREQDNRQVHLITLDQIAAQISQGGYKELPLIVKGDVDGSVEALADSLMKLSNSEVVIKVIHKSVGAISESDVLLAAASNAIIIGFHVRPNVNARKLAESESVDIRLYNVIYDAINEVKSALEGMLSPVLSEELVATLEIRETFKVPKIGTVAGCYVQEGKINRNDKIRLFRDGIVIYEGNLATLKRFKDDVRDVDAGYECGLNIANFNDIKNGDIIESFKVIETKKKLSS
ncbi:MAG: translation initiation factor IF-2 [Ignavibacteriae bacterium HGW-Ignavibacteriae-2]|jgi:translation initiation factor IF-2|nr:translation initiation factor IF-2 [Bacteroidota bacterium]PKL88527.1 MAG: translation initiation factor IF-2 [Ignavibacteriae bacterium HGW-Ignavibacteriae-2]